MYITFIEAHVKKVAGIDIGDYGDVSSPSNMNIKATGIMEYLIEADPLSRNIHISATRGR